jgi:hypothetical protein
MHIDEPRSKARIGPSARLDGYELAANRRRVFGVLREPLAAAPNECLLSVAADAPGSRMPLGQGPAGVALPMLEKKYWSCTAPSARH